MPKLIRREQVHRRHELIVGFVFLPDGLSREPLMKSILAPLKEVSSRRGIDGYAFSSAVPWMSTCAAGFWISIGNQPPWFLWGETLNKGLPSIRPHEKDRPSAGWIDLFSVSLANKKADDYSVGRWSDVLLLSIGFIAYIQKSAQIFYLHAWLTGYSIFWK